jgi:hypothetical protein
MSERRNMGVSDWINATINAAIGVLLGSVIYGLVQLIVGGAWLMAVIIFFLFAGLFLFLVLSDKLFDRVFKIGIRPAKTPQTQQPKPLLRVLSFPSGVILGVVLAVLGLDRTILSFLS